MLWSVGFMVTFLLGGLTGVLLASPPLDWHLNDSYFVVAHFHYVLFGTIVFAAFAGIYFWFPKMSGRMMDERLGKLHFWMTFIGFHATFLIQHWLGNQGMPRRYVDYLPTDEFTTMHTISTIGSFVLGAATFPFVYNVWRSWKYSALALRVTTRGNTATRWNGRPLRHRPGTTSSRSPGSGRNGPRSRCTIRISWSDSRRRPSRAGGTSPTSANWSPTRVRAKAPTIPTRREDVAVARPRSAS
jgi:heme/copper-type cytochrome/quinol oxidase subunit 1